MNFLGHAWLGHRGSDDFLFGNLIADGVKGRDLTAWPQAVGAGIRHHRRVDARIDGDPELLALRRRSPEGLRRYSGIALDLMWDHFLARDGQGEAAHRALVARCYGLLEARPAPARLATMMPLLVDQDWLNGYADFAFTQRALAGLGRRLPPGNRLAELAPWLEAEYPHLEAAFYRLWPRLERELGRP
ncbi:acyl carrier protein phosphodiesterase [Halomonas sp. 328]|uniref:acyl carrier protein phosphodiesterase n=1 Tax=Halomonas sp. 328 TaxID=2776704 RepID=UPI0018A7474D|nr:ACP phosphodiesterase [Halomonas sp. 328]MBF8221584.1 DUF479 domain-containing protein [Halomonas sp. 328]